MPTNKTTQSILELEAILKVIPCDDIRAFITANSKEEFEDSASYLKCKIFHPFEGFENDFFYFDYVVGNMRITIKGKEVYRVQTIIKEI